ncbi:MAG TPA: hypothetical protein VGD00_01140 [Solirubrobacteraceae bacterium]
MAVLRLVRRVVAEDVYDRVVADMQLHSEHPLGLIMHGASRVDGEAQIAQVWDSYEYAERFEKEILGPALRAAGIEEDDAQVTILELHDLVTP